MNHYASTYQKDYIGPHTSRVCQPKPSIQLITPAQSCTCTDFQVLKALLDVSLGESLDWNQMAPMGRLFDPKLHPTKFKKIPEIPDTTRFYQPRICMKEFEVRCPEQCEMKPHILPDETIAMVEADRLKTTYQMDYSDPAAKRMMQYKPSTVTDGQLQCCMPIKITIEADCCQPRYHPHSSRRNTNYNGPSARKYEYKRRNGSRRDKKCKDIVGGQTLPAWKTEYQDNINKIGRSIMRMKLHQGKKAIVPVWTTSS